jgi:hypothetical protein
MVEPVESLTGETSAPTRMEAAVRTRCRSALRSQTAAAAARQHRKQLLQLQVLLMGTGIKIRTPTIRMFKKEINIKRTIKDRITLTTAVITAAAVPMKKNLFNAE